MSYARPRVIGDKDIRSWIKSRQEAGKDNPDTAGYIAKQLEKGNALGAKAANAFGAGKYEPEGQRLSRSFASRWGVEEIPASIAGLSGLKIAKGDVYLGSAQREVPGYSHTDHQSGHTATPGRTEYYPSLMRRADFRSRLQEQPKADDSSGVKAPVDPGVDLLAAREAYDRANAYTNGTEGAASGGSFASPLDLGKSGDDLFNAIAADGQRGLDDYERRFVPRLFANANLTAQEIGYAGQSAIANLPDDLKLPEYSKIFPDRAEKKGGLYKWLEKRIA